MSKIEYIGKCLLLDVGEKKILVVGDLHLGYEESMNQSGVLVSRQMFKELTEEFEEIFEKTGKVDEIVLLGDVKHEFGTVLQQEWKDIIALFDFFKKYCDKIVVVKGNHDKILEPIVNKRDILLLDYYIVDEFCFLHGDREFEEIEVKEIKYWVMGHLHPAISLKDYVKIEKYKCFLEGKYRDKKVIILPSFFSLVEGSDPRDEGFNMVWKFEFDDFNVKIVGEKLEVLDFGKLSGIK